MLFGSKAWRFNGHLSVQLLSPLLIVPYICEQNFIYMVCLRLFQFTRLYSLSFISHLCTGEGAGENDPKIGSKTVLRACVECAENRGFEW